MNLSHQIAKILLEKQAVKISLDNPFTWTSGIRSPIYCDNRKLISHNDARKLIVNGFKTKIEELGWNFDALSGTATAGIPWAAFLAQELDVPMVYVRPKPKEHGAGKQVEGDADALRGKKILVIEDLFSTGGSSIRSAEAVEKEMDAEIVGLVAIFSYGFAECVKNFEESGYKYESLSTLEAMLDLDEFQSMKADVLPFKDDPRAWFDNLNKNE